MNDQRLKSLFSITIKFLKASSGLSLQLEQDLQQVERLASRFFQPNETRKNDFEEDPDILLEEDVAEEFETFVEE